MSYSQHITRAAYCKQQDKSSFVVEEGQQSISLQKYLLYCGDFCSLHTKLYFLIEVAKGIRALSVRNVLYLNLKPSNIMINGKVNCYFTDMSWAVKLPSGQTSVPADQKHASRMGMSFPDKSYSIKTDVYLMGKLMLNLLLDQKELPIDRKVRMLGAGYLSQQHSLPELNSCRQQMRECLPSCIADQLMQLIWRCVSPNPDLRPSIEWVIAILAEVRLAVLYD